MPNKKDTVSETGHPIEGAASFLERAEIKGAKARVECAKTGEDEGIGGIHEHMPVYAACGKRVGVVAHIQGNTITLTGEDSPNGQQHFVPTAWIGRVHEGHVHLTRTGAETEQEWMGTVTACESWDT